MCRISRTREKSSRSGRFVEKHSWTLQSAGIWYAIRNSCPVHACCKAAESYCDRQVEATCGGACECATCHVHLRPADHGKPAPVPEVTDEEDDQLEYAMFADDDSRLACQIEITEDLVSWLEKQGGRVQLPRY